MCWLISRCAKRSHPTNGMTVVAVIVERLKANDLVGGLCRGIEASGVILARAYPPGKGDNPNELPNEVIQGA